MTLEQISQKETVQPDAKEIMTLGYMIQAGLDNNELALFCVRMGIEERVLVLLKEHFRNDNELL